MFSKLKYILFDFSDSFKNDFMNTFKKSIAFLIIGIIMFPFMDKVEVVGEIGGLLYLFLAFYGEEI